MVPNLLPREGAEGGEVAVVRKSSDALGVPDFRCTSWAQSVESLARSVRSLSCSSSDSLSSASSGGRWGSASSKTSKQPKIPPTKPTQKKVVGASGWRPTVGDVQEGASVIPEGVPPVQPAMQSSSAGSTSSSSPGPAPSGMRLEGYLKKKNPHGITWCASLASLLRFVHVVASHQDSVLSLAQVQT